MNEEKIALIRLLDSLDRIIKELENEYKSFNDIALDEILSRLKPLRKSVKIFNPSRRYPERMKRRV